MSEFNEIKRAPFKAEASRAEKFVVKFLSEHGNVPSDYLAAELELVEGKEGERLRKWFGFYCKAAPFKRGDKRRKNGLLLTGDFGFGKTGAACSIAKEFVRHGALVWFERELDMLDAFRDWERKKKAQRHWLLILDDVGAHESERFGERRDALESIIRFRKDANLPTIITTNLDRKSLEDHLSPVLTIIGAHYSTIEFSAKNWRAEEAKEFRFRV